MSVISVHPRHDACLPSVLNCAFSRFRLVLPLVAFLSFHALHASASEKAEDYVFAGKVKEDLSSQTSSVLGVDVVTKTEIPRFVGVGDSAMVENEGAGWKVKTVKTLPGFDVEISFGKPRNYVEEGRNCYFTTWEELELRVVGAKDIDWQAILKLYQAVEGKERLAGIVAKRLNVALDNASEVSLADARAWLGYVKELGGPDGAIFQEQPLRVHLVDLKRALDAAIGQEQVERNAIRDDYFEVFREEPPVPREPPAVLLVANVGEVDLRVMILGGWIVKPAGQTLFEISAQNRPQGESWPFEPFGPDAGKFRGGTFAPPVDLKPGCTSRVEIAAAHKGPPRLAAVNRMGVPVKVSVNGLAPFALGGASASTNDLSSVGGMAEGAAAAVDHPEDYLAFAFKTNALQDEIATVEIVLEAKAAPVVRLSNPGDVDVSVVVGGRRVGLKPGKTEQIPLDPRKAATVEASVEAGHPEDYVIGIAGAAEESASGVYSIKAMLPGEDAGTVEVSARLRPAPKLVLDNGGNAVEVRYAIRDAAGKEVAKGSVRATGRGEVEVPVRTELSLAYEAVAEGYHVPQPLKVEALARGASSSAPLKLAQKDPVLPLKNEGTVPLEVAIAGTPPFKLEPGAIVERELKPRTQPGLGVRVSAEHPEDYSVVLQKGQREAWAPVESGLPLPSLEPGTKGSEWRFKAVQKPAPKLTLDNSANAVEVRYAIRDAEGKEVAKGSVRATGRGEVEVPVRSELVVAYEAEAEGYHAPQPLKVPGLARGAASTVSLPLAQKDPVLPLKNEGQVPLELTIAGTPPFRLDPGAIVERELKPRTQPGLGVRVATEHPEDYSVLLQKGPRAAWTPVEADMPLPSLEPGTKGSEWRFKVEQKSAPKLMLDNSANAVEVRYAIRDAEGKEVAKGSVLATGRDEVEVPVRTELTVAYEAEAEGYHAPQPLKVPGLSRGGGSRLEFVLKPKSMPKLNLVNESAVDAKVEVVGIASVKVPKGGRTVVEVPANRLIELVCSAADPKEAYVGDEHKLQSPDWEQEVDFTFKLKPDQTARVDGIVKKWDNKLYSLFSNRQSSLQEEDACLVWALCYCQSTINRDYLDRVKKERLKPEKNILAFRIEDTQGHLKLMDKFNLANRTLEGREKDLEYVDFDREAGGPDLAEFRRWVEDGPVKYLQAQLTELEKLGRQ